MSSRASSTASRGAWRSSSGPRVQRASGPCARQKASSRMARGSPAKQAPPRPRTRAPPAAWSNPSALRS
eukprot:1905514-Alexandrium_andersonii.AAC.1